MKQSKSDYSNDIAMKVPFDVKKTNMEDQFNWTSQTIIQHCQ